MLSMLRYAVAKRMAPELADTKQADLVFENLALRQQLAIYKHAQPRRKVANRDRLFWVLYRRVFPERWRNVLFIVKPDTVVRWHRAGFRLYWRLRSGRHGGGGRKPLRKEVQALINRMAMENGYGATRIHGELLKLGLEVSERTVSNYLRKRFPYPEDRMKQWLAFLRNESVAAMDFAVVPTALYNRFLYALVIIGHGRRKVLHVNVIEHPTGQWVAQQLREAFPGDVELPRYLVHDRDRIFCSREVQDALIAIGIRSSQTAYHSPWQNGICERFIGTLRRELLTRVIIFGERHLLLLLREFVTYYNAYRPHLTLQKDSPLGRAVQERPCEAAKVVSIPHVGGLHHHYEWSIGGCVAADLGREPA